MWQIQKNDNGFTIVDQDGSTIAELPGGKIKNAHLLAAAPELLAACTQSDNASLPDTLRHLAKLQENLANGPFNLPLDQIMRLTNELQNSRAFLGDLADRIESALKKVAESP